MGGEGEGEMAVSTSHRGAGLQGRRGVKCVSAVRKYAFGAGVFSWCIVCGVEKIRSETGHIHTYT